MADGRPKEVVFRRERPSLQEEIIVVKKDPLGLWYSTGLPRHFASFQFSSVSLDCPGLKIIKYNPKHSLN